MRPNLTKLPMDFFINANDWLDDIVDTVVSIEDKGILREYLKEKFNEVFSKIK